MSFRHVYHKHGSEVMCTIVETINIGSQHEIVKKCDGSTSECKIAEVLLIMRKNPTTMSKSKKLCLYLRKICVLLGPLVKIILRY
jgi:hypothetical protein